MTNRKVAALLLLATLSACTSLGASGPTSRAIRRAATAPATGPAITLIDLDETAVRNTRTAAETARFSQVFGAAAPAKTVISSGDLVELAIWEAPPAVLFGATASSAGLVGAPGAMASTIPPQTVSDEGTITVPFVGELLIRGLTPKQVQQKIAARLAGRAHSPQVIVRIAQNDTRTVTVLGEVASSRQIPLTPRGERLLDIIAAAGGPRQPIGKSSIQLAREGRVGTMALEGVIRDPSENVPVRAGDVVTVLFQPFTFVALGAVNQSAEIPFEGGGISLAQALGRMGGLRDDRANVHGVFVFRLEDPKAIDPALASVTRQTADGRVPVVYRLDMGSGSSLFLAQDFQIRNHDVIYIANAPIADIQKFVNTLSGAAFSIIGIGNAIK